MNLRTRLLLAQLPLLLATALTIAFALWVADRLAARPSAMLDDNLRSLDAATTMLDALARLEADATQAEAATQTFDQALALQRSNVTEPGEDLATAALHDAWQRVRGHALPATADLLALRDAIEAIVAINRAAMRSKAEQLRSDARRETLVIAFVGLLGLALALPLGLVLLRRTLWGKGVRALMQSPTGAQLVGIDTERLHPLMFGVGLGLSGVAGCLLSMTYTITPAMGEPYTVTALIVITLGGFGSMSGALVGGLALGVIEAVGMHFTSPSLKALLSYGIFIAVLLWRPNGLFTRK